MLSSIMTPLGGLLAALGAFAAFYVTVWWSAVSKAKPIESALELGTGFVTNFFDTLGIGSFAPTTAIFKFFKVVPDRRIPGTLNVGHTLPTIAQAFIYTVAIDVDPRTLIFMIAAAVAGAWRRARGSHRGPHCQGHGHPHRSLARRRRGHRRGGVDAPVGGQGGVASNVDVRVYAYIPRSFVTTATRLMATT